MTRNDSITDVPNLTEMVDRAVAIHGAIPVLIRAIRATFRVDRPPPLISVDDLPSHLRKDIGFAPKVDMSTAQMRFF